ncbi:hypothetical protein EL17_07295 [Anditalea andensis]|uniref:DUF2752 domain-containing protein n=2 Tax=Anditalea andensis TaxID=1048983 RepID=A0A074KVE5_9BACT|nr:hypothetical protein EL17_07295 [Anditalea andensis]
MRKILNIKEKLPVELIFWLGALISLALMKPGHDHHFTLCPISYIGFSWCPGCGLGRAINLMLHGHFSASFSMHPLAGLAIVVIIWRIIQLIKNIKNFNYYG